MYQSPETVKVQFIEYLIFFCDDWPYLPGDLYGDL